MLESNVVIVAKIYLRISAGFPDFWGISLEIFSDFFLRVYLGISSAISPAVFEMKSLKIS